jgi:hypothetical protein
LDVIDTNTYNRLYDFFNEILSSDTEYVIFLARKAYVLFKVFEDLVEADGKSKIVLHDRAMDLYVNSINNKSKILIVDDTVLYGRTICNVIDRLFSEFNVDPDNITVAVFAVNQELIDQKRDDQERKISKYGDNYRLSFINDEKKLINIPLLYSRNYSPVFCNIDFIRSLSAKFISVIHASSVPYVDCTPAFEIDFSADDKISSLYMSPENYCRKITTIANISYEYYDITTPTLEELKIKAFAVGIPLGINESFSCVRIYLNESLRKIVVIPYVFFPAIKNTYEYYDEIKKLFDLGQNLESLTKNRLLHYYISYILGKHFFDLLQINCSNIKLVSSGGIAQQDINRIVTVLNDSDLNQVKEIFSNITPVIDNSIGDIKEEPDIVQNSFNDAVMSNHDVDKGLFSFLSEFLVFFAERDAILEKRSNGILISSLLGKIYETLRFPEITEKRIYVDIIKLCDLGHAVPQILEMKSVTGCFIKPGEQAVNFYVGELPFLFLIGQLYELLKDEWDKVKKNVFEYINKYRKINLNLDISRLVVELVTNYSDKEKDFSFKPNEFKSKIPAKEDSKNEEKEKQELMNFFWGLCLYYPSYMKNNNHYDKDDFDQDKNNFIQFVASKKEKMGTNSQYLPTLFSAIQRFS